jgi:hypothetical protein
MDLVARRETELGRRDAEAQLNDEALAHSRRSEALLRAELDRVNRSAAWRVALRLRSLAHSVAGQGTRRRRILRRLMRGLLPENAGTASSDGS